MKNKIIAGIIILNCSFLNVISQEGKKNSLEKSSPKQFFSKELFLGGEDNVFEYRIPSIVTTNKGTLVAVCDARVDKRGDAPNNIDLVMKRSYDNGKSWSEMQIILDYPGNEAACDPSMVVNKQSGTIWLAYDYAVPDPQGDHGRILRIHISKSDDDGSTWSSPVELSHLTKGKDFWLQNGPGVGLYNNGIIIFPMYSVTSGSKGSEKTVLVYTRDNGNTWNLSNGVGDNNPEPQIVKLKRDRIMANMRRPYGYGNRQVAITDNLGDSWYDLRNDPILIESGCHGSIINYEYGNKSLLVFSNPADRKGRNNMVVRTSNDEGVTWQKEIPVYTGSAAYSCLTQLPNGNIGLLYEADNYNKIVFVEIPSGEL